MFETSHNQTDAHTVKRRTFAPEIKNFSYQKIMAAYLYITIEVGVMVALIAGIVRWNEKH